MDPNMSFMTVLQNSISPIALISGVGLLLISLTNRLSRTIDAVRKMSKEVNTTTGKEQERKVTQLKIIYKRSKLLRNGISSIAFSIFSSSLIVLLNLIMTITNHDLHTLAMVLLFFSISGIIGAAFFLFFDVTLTLTALSYEVEDYLE